MDRRYRVIFAADSHLRLMENAADPPAQWIQVITLPNGETTEILVRDVIETANEIPYHRGLHIQIAVTAADIDLAIESAHRSAETAMLILAAAGRAPISPAELILAYEITPGVTERPLVQRFPAPELPMGKTPVPRAVFFGLIGRMLEQTEPTLAWRVTLSMSWHRQALDEKEPVFRFLNLWIAFEALGPRLDDLYNIPEDDRSGFRGLRRFADDVGYGSETVTVALGIRRDLFHARRVLPAVVRVRAIPLLPILERLLIAAWSRLLGVPELADQFPSSAVTPHPVQWEIRAVLLQEDVSMYGPDSHPHFVANLSLQRLPPAHTGAVTIQQQASWRIENITGQCRGETWALTGPFGPNITTFSDVLSTVTRAAEPSDDALGPLPAPREC